MLDPALLNKIGTGMSVFGNVFGAFGDINNGKVQKAEADYEAAQLRINAGQAQAAGQREAISADQQGKLVASRALALAAASGGGASDPTVVHLISGIAAEGAYRQALALYQGDEQARALNMKADATQYSGELAKQAGFRSGVGKFVGAGTNAIQGIARGQSLLEKYGGGGPSLSK